MSKIYQLSKTGRNITYARWLNMGGCGLPNNSNAPSVLGPVSKWDEDFPTLGQIEDACPYTGRTLAGYAMRQLGNDLMVIEYKPNSH